MRGGPLSAALALTLGLSPGWLPGCASSDAAAQTGARPSAGPGGAPRAEGRPASTRPATPPPDEDGSALWLRYPEVSLRGRLAEYRAGITHLVRAGGSATLQAAERELSNGLGGLLGVPVPVRPAPAGAGAVIVGTPASSPLVARLGLGALASVGAEGFVVQAVTVDGHPALVVAGNTDVGALRGAFALLRRLQRQQPLAGLSLAESPKLARRLLDHWDNLDGTVERGYAGRSLWQWSALPATLSPRYTDYARANASIGVNGVVLNNVNADARILTRAYVAKVAALADVFRPYGIKVYLSAAFAAPRELGGLPTADPAQRQVRQWWVAEANMLYGMIPDFGGFLVKANSEGQPGPADYGRTQAEGANMLEAALAPHGGVVLWRAFVYRDDGTDRVGQAYRELRPLDGKFEAGTLVQAKNGPLDFQPREPFHPLFGGLPRTPLALEVQITKEYLGADTHLAYLGPLWQEVLRADTAARGPGSTVGHTLAAMAGVAGIGTDADWMGSHFNQANWYAFGRLAWDPDLSAQAIAEEWIRETFSNDPGVVAPVLRMMMISHQTLVSYMEPLGLVHLMATNTHYGPAPWVDDLPRRDWNPTYFHRADAAGIGFDRTSTGSDTVAQYAPAVAQAFADAAAVPDDLLLFFQRRRWTDTLASSGRTVWHELVHRYSAGVDAVQVMRELWGSVRGAVDDRRWRDVAGFLQIQHHEARWWRDACLTYFMSVNKLPLPSGYAPPEHDLAYYQRLPESCPADPSKPRCPPVYTGQPSPAIIGR